MTDEKLIKDAQYRKGLSIAYFNSLNAAIELAKSSVIIKNGELVKDEDEVRAFVSRWRDWFLEEHRVYYANVIANAGANFKAGEALAKLESAKNYEELSSIWRLLSEDERRDEGIISKARELKEKFVNKEANEKA